MINKSRTKMNAQKHDFLLQIKNLCCEYTLAGKVKRILDDLQLEIMPAKIVGIIGKSGSGKTSLLNAISGIDQTCKGKIIFAGQNIFLLKEKDLVRWRNLKLGIIFQQYHLLAEFNVLENVILPALVYQKDKKKITAKALMLLEQVGIKEKKYHKIGELSGGEMQRVAIARAMINDPLLLLADEPTGNLDENNAQIVFNILKKIAKEKKTTILFVSHAEKLIQKCDQSYHLEKGKLKKIV